LGINPGRMAPYSAPVNRPAIHSTLASSGITYIASCSYCEWLLRRYRAAENQMWRYQNEPKYSMPPA
jgi:hypothetical protein